MFRKLMNSLFKKNQKEEKVAVAEKYEPETKHKRKKKLKYKELKEEFPDFFEGKITELTDSERIQKITEELNILKEELKIQKDLVSKAQNKLHFTDGRTLLLEASMKSLTKKVDGIEANYEADCFLMKKMEFKSRRE